MLMINKKHVFIFLSLTFYLFSLNAQTCIDLLDAADRTAETRTNTSAVSEFTPQNLLGFEMTASMVVWNLINTNKLKISLTDATQNQDSIYESLTQQQTTMINSELQKAFDAIFNGNDDRGQEGYLLWAQSSVDGFSHDVLSELFQRDENFVIEFLKKNLEAIIYNGRRMTWLYKTWLPFRPSDIGARILYPRPLSSRAKKIWLALISVSAAGSFLAPHADILSAFQSCARGECYEFYYIFDESVRYIDDPGGKVHALLQSLESLGWASLGIGPIYAISRGWNSWRGTRNSPEVDLINYNDQVGADIRDSFAERAGQADQSAPRQVEMEL